MDKEMNKDMEQKEVIEKVRSLESSERTKIVKKILSVHGLDLDICKSNLLQIRTSKVCTFEVNWMSKKTLKSSDITMLIDTLRILAQSFFEDELREENDEQTLKQLTELVIPDVLYDQEEVKGEKNG